MEDVTTWTLILSVVTTVAAFIELELTSALASLLLPALALLSVGLSVWVRLSYFRARAARVSTALQLVNGARSRR